MFISLKISLLNTSESKKFSKSSFENIARLVGINFKPIYW